jgi:hypothetical protein
MSPGHPPLVRSDHRPPLLGPCAGWQGSPGVHPRLAEMARRGDSPRPRLSTGDTQRFKNILGRSSDLPRLSPTPSSISKTCLGSPLHAPRVPTDEQLDPMVAGSRLGGDKRRPQRWAPQGGPLQGRDSQRETTEQHCRARGPSQVWA